MAADGYIRAVEHHKGFLKCDKIGRTLGKERTFSPTQLIYTHTMILDLQCYAQFSIVITLGIFCSTGVKESIYAFLSVKRLKRW